MDCLKYFKSLSDETRVRLFNILMVHELSVNEIVMIMNMGQSRISRHLKILIDAGILRCRRDGVWAFYSTVDTGPGKQFGDSIRYLLNDDVVLKNDLMRASHIINERKLKAVHFFNKIAPKWNVLQQTILGDFDLNAAILQHIHPCGAAVDLGCGTGELLIHMAAKCTHTIGVDSSMKMLEETRKKFEARGKEVDLRLGELEHLPLENYAVDYAVVSMVLHHLPNPAKIFAEVRRILKRDGAFIIADFAKHKNERMRDIHEDRWLGFSHEEIKRWLNNCGFKLTSTQSFRLQKKMQITLYESIKTTHKGGISND